METWTQHNACANVLGQELEGRSPTADQIHAQCLWFIKGCARAECGWITVVTIQDLSYTVCELKDLLPRTFWLPGGKLLCG